MISLQVNFHSKFHFSSLIYEKKYAQTFIRFYWICLAGITMAGVLTQLDTPALAADYSWDWGMGWGWSGYSASYCSTCAMEQAALINSNIGSDIG